MNKKCARCVKTVYPIEQVNCLDQVWHKACFKCDTCGMTLNMKNYKGYDKRPYCNTHYPTTRFTAVAETPEMKRIAENTKIQSNVSYHADFEKLKGKKTSVMDDPETQRIKKNTAIQSSVLYQNVAQKKLEMESRRPEQVMDGPRGRSNPGKISDYEPDVPPQGPVGGNYRSPRNSQDMNYTPQPSGLNYPTSYNDRGDAVETSIDDIEVQNGQQVGRRQPGSISDYDPMAGYGSQGYNQPAPQPTFQGGYGQQQRRSGPPSYKAIYDYTAADDDEVSFCEGDIVVNCEIIDAGWMTGTIKRTGESGMLPSNYVEAI